MMYGYVARVRLAFSLFYRVGGRRGWEEGVRVGGRQRASTGKKLTVDPGDSGQRWFRPIDLESVSVCHRLLSHMHVRQRRHKG